MAEHDCRAHVAGVKNILDAERVRAMTLDELDDTSVNFLKSRGKCIARARPDYSALDEMRRRTPLALHNSIACDSSARVDPQNDHALLLLFDITIRGDFLDVVEILELLEELYQ
jgi:hypothetical protein